MYLVSLRIYLIHIVQVCAFSHPGPNRHFYLFLLPPAVTVSGTLSTRGHAVPRRAEHARANPATRCGARVGTPGHPGGRRFTPRRSSRPWRCSWLLAWEVPRPRARRGPPPRRSADSRRRSRRPRARARSSSARGRRFRPWEIARTRSRRPRRRPGCRHRRRPRRRTPPSFSRGRRGTASSRSTAPTDPFRAPSHSGARRCGG